MFLTSPYPASLEVMLFGATNDIRTGHTPSNSYYMKNEMTFWNQVLSSADSYPNIQVNLMMAVGNMSDPLSYQFWQYFVDGVKSHSSLYSIGIEGEYSGSSTQALYSQFGAYVTQAGKQFINYYGAFGFPDVFHTNWPYGDFQQLELHTSPSTVGISSGYDSGAAFPETRPLPTSTTYQMNQFSPPYGWNQAVVSAILSASAQVADQYRQFVHFTAGATNNGLFLGASGAITTALWDNPTLRNWIWVDPNYQNQFILSTAPSSSASTTSTSTGSSTSTNTLVSNSTSSNPFSLEVQGICPTSGAATFAPEAIAIVSSLGVCNRNESSGLRVASWSIDGGPNRTIDTTGVIHLTVLMNSSHVLRFHVVYQFRITLDYGATVALTSITPSTIPGDYLWYDAGTVVEYKGNATTNAYRMLGWSWDDGPPTPITDPALFVVSPVLMNSHHSLHVLISSTPSDPCIPPSLCDQHVMGWVLIDSNAPAGVQIEVDGIRYPAQVSFAWPLDSYHLVSAPSEIRTGSMRSAFAGWYGSINSSSSSLNFPAAGLVRLFADYGTQYLTQFSFADANGSMIVPQSVEFVGPAGSFVLPGNLSSWLESGKEYRIASSYWEGVDVVESGSQALISASSPGVFVIHLAVYPQTISVTDLYGLPVGGATVELTTLGGVKVSVVTEGNGRAEFDAPLGLYALTVSWMGFSNGVSLGTIGSHNVSVSSVLSYPVVASLVAAIISPIAWALKRRSRAMNDIYNQPYEDSH